MKRASELIATILALTIREVCRRASDALYELDCSRLEIARLRVEVEALHRQIDELERV